MARDYVNRRSDRKPSQHETARGSKRSSMSPWIVTGVLIGIFIAGTVYFKMQHAHMFAEQMAESNQLPAQTPAAAPTVEQKPDVSTKSPQPQFDFYTVLPKDDKAIPTDNVAQVNNAVKPKQVNPAELLSEAAKNAAPVVVAPTKTEAVKQPVEKEPPVTTVELPPVSQNDSATAESHKTPVVEKQKLAQEIALAAQQALPTKVSANQQYILVLGTFKDYSGADGKRAQLALQGIEANIKEISKSGVKAYRVWVGPYSSLKAAQKQQHHLQSEQVKSVLIKDE
jgi:cell division protein FtsN